MFVGTGVTCPIAAEVPCCSFCLRGILRRRDSPRLAPPPNAFAKLFSRSGRGPTCLFLHRVTRVVLFTRSRHSASKSHSPARNPLQLLTRPTGDRRSSANSRSCAGGQHGSAVSRPNFRGVGGGRTDAVNPPGGRIQIAPVSRPSARPVGCAMAGRQMPSASTCARRTTAPAPVLGGNQCDHLGR